MTRPPDPAVLASARSRPDSTIDNGATTTEMRLLARVYKASGDRKYRDAVLRAAGHASSKPSTRQFPGSGACG